MGLKIRGCKDTLFQAKMAIKMVASATAEIQAGFHKNSPCF